MKKLLSSIIGGALGLALVAGVGVSIGVNQKAEYKEAEAAESTYAQAIFNSTNNKSSISSYTAQWTNTTNNFSWTITNFNNNKTSGNGGGTWSYIKCGRNGVASVASIETSKSLSIAISSVSITIDALTSSKINSITLYGGANATTSLGTFEKSTGTKTLTISSPAPNQKYKIVVDCASGSSNGLLTLSNVALKKDSSSPTLKSLALEGNLEKTSYIYGEAWSHSGLTLKGTYSDNTTITVLSNAASWSYTPGVAIIGVNQLSMTATIDGISASHSETVSVSKVASPFINGVEYRMFLNNGDKNYYYDGSTVATYYGGTTTTAASAKTMYFEANGDGQNLYYLDGSTKNYLTAAASGTHVNFTISTTTPTSAWYYNGHTIAYYISSNDCCYTPGNYGTNTTFSMFASYFTEDYYAQFELVSGLTAEQFASQLLEVIVCDGTGETAPTLDFNYTWDDLKAVYNQLDSSEKTRLQSASANPDGTDIENAVARYDIVVAKYGYENFINRTISNKANRMNLVVNSNTMIIVITVVSVISAAALAAYFILRKKKEA